MRRLLLVLLIFSGAALAGVINPGQWYGFMWSGSSFPIATTGQQTSSVDASVLDPGSGPWTIDLAAPAYLIVVDGFASGDQFEAFDGGVSLGLTLSVSTGTDECSGGDGPNHCLADSRYSSGSFLLGAGSHSLTISTVSGYTSGGAWFGVGTSEVPEPSTMALVGLAGLGLLAWRRKR